MYIVEGGVFTDTSFTKIEPGTEERYGPFLTYEDAEKAWSSYSRWKVDICTHRLNIRED